MEAALPNLAKQFEQDMLDDSREYTRRTKTNPSRYLQMISQHGGIETARMLASDPTFHEGFTRAWEFGCLNLTAEYLIAYARDGEYHQLFNAGEIQSAKTKLAKVGVAQAM